MVSRDFIKYVHSCCKKHVNSWWNYSSSVEYSQLTAVSLLFKAVATSSLYHPSSNTAEHCRPCSTFISPNLIVWNFFILIRNFWNHSVRRLGSRVTISANPEHGQGISKQSYGIMYFTTVTRIGLSKLLYISIWNRSFSILYRTNISQLMIGLSQ